MSKARSYRFRPLKELNVIDDFLFAELCQDTPEGRSFVRIILETVLGRQIEVESVIAQRTIQGVDTDRHGIRLDAYIISRRKKDECGESTEQVTVYDVEPDNNSAQKKSLPRRNRYYQAIQDVRYLKRGKKYKLLPDMVSIFLLSYDPFGAGAMYYEAKMLLITHPELSYDDGIRWIYLYVDGDPEKGTMRCSMELVHLLHYIRDSREENVVDSVTEQINFLTEAIREALDTDLGYAKYMDRLDAIKEEMREELKDEVHDEVRKELKNEVHDEVRKELKDEVHDEVRDEGEICNLIKLVRKKIAKGKPLSEIAEDLEETEEEISPIYEAVLAAEEDTAPEEIAEKLLMKV